MEMFQFRPWKACRKKNGIGERGSGWTIVLCQKLIIILATLQLQYYWKLTPVLYLFSQNFLFISSCACLVISLIICGINVRWLLLLRWKHCISSNYMKPILYTILDCINDYLREGGYWLYSIMVTQYNLYIISAMQGDN